MLSVARRSICCPLILSAILANAWAEPPRVLPAGKLPQDKRLGPLKDLDGYFPFTPCATREAWEHRAGQLRRQVLLAAGLWPMPPVTPGQPVIHGRVDRDGYTVEKVYFESYPGLFVTGNLYRPKGRSGKLPAVLCPHGHWPEGRFYDAGPKEIRKQIVMGAERFEFSGRYPLQARCVQLARMGCVVFHYDMVGYADSKQLDHRAGIRPEMNGPRRWGFFSPQAEARLQTVFGLQTYDSIRALDFLCGLPDVDATRIAVTGASGGGTQTLILCAADPRPAVSVPAVMVSTAMQGGCPCENACYLRIGTGNVELAAVMAPKPLGLLAADDWTKEIATKGLPELKKLYGLFGAEELVMAKPLLQFPHNYNYVSREVMYHWLNKHLKLGLEEPIVEEDFRPLSVAEMSVWDAKHPAPPRGEEFERALLQRMTDQSRRQIEALRPHDGPSLAEYRRVVGGAVETMIGRGLPDKATLEVVPQGWADGGGSEMKDFLLRNRAFGEELPAFWQAFSNWHWKSNRRVVIVVDRCGRELVLSAENRLGPERRAYHSLYEKGCAVLVADLFGQGKFIPDGNPLTKQRLNKSKACPDKEQWGEFAGYTFGYNPPLFCQRVHDILSLVAYAHSMGDGDAPVKVDVVGLGGAGHWLAAARAIAGGAIDRAVIDTAGFRFANVTATDDPDFLPGGAKYDDLPGMLALSAPHPLWLAGEDAAAVALVSAAYRAAGRPQALNIFRGKDRDQESAAVEWLLKGRALARISHRPY